MVTGNRLVLVASGPVSLEPVDGFPLAAALGQDHLAMALVDAVPAGIYGKAALTTLGIWSEVAPLVAQTDNARSALALVVVLVGFRIGELLRKRVSQEFFRKAVLIAFLLMGMRLIAIGLT